MSARICRCDACGAPVALRDPRCGYCNASQTWSAAQELARGDALETWDLRSRALEAWAGYGEERAVTALPTTPEGARVVTEPAGRVRGELGPRLRDGAVRVQVCAEDGDACFGVRVRAQSLGATEVSYVACVWPGRRAAGLFQRVHGDDHAHSVALADWRVVASLDGVGAWNALELRAADAVLQVFVNDVLAIAAEDADLTFGRLGWEAGSAGNRPARLTVRAIAAWRV